MPRRWWQRVKTFSRRSRSSDVRSSKRPINHFPYGRSLRKSNCVSTRPNFSSSSIECRDKCGRRPFSVRQTSSSPYPSSSNELRKVPDVREGSGSSRPKCLTMAERAQSPRNSRSQSRTRLIGWPESTRFGQLHTIPLRIYSTSRAARNALGDPRRLEVARHPLSSRGTLGAMGAPTGSVFISYRRDDAPFAAHALYANLARRFAEHQIFMDVQGGVHAGAEFADLVRDKVARRDVLVAIIGPGWSQATDTQGRLRLKLADDLVRVEISSALRAKKRVVPVLVGGAACQGVAAARSSTSDTPKCIG